MDAGGLVALGVAGAATAASAVAARRSRWRTAVALLLLAGAALRVNLAAHAWLGEWDERFHALVARNLIDHPLEPTLIDRPLVDVPPRHWGATRVWLQKPPLALWLMAGSLWAFGESEIAARIPSLVFGTLGIAVTFLLCRRFVSREAAWAAAAFHAWHGRSALLSGGLRSSDHVDSIFIFLAGLGALLAVETARAWPARAAAARGLAAATGVVFGLAWLTMSALALAIPGVLFLALLGATPRWRDRLVGPLAVLAIGLAAALPWQLYCAQHYPEAFAYASQRNWRHLSEVVEGHEHPWHFHLVNISRYFGVLTGVPLVAFLVEGVRRRREWLPLLGWLLVTYGVFSLAATKLKSYPFMASPVIWCALGWFCVRFATQAHASRGRRLLARGAVAAVVVLFLLTSSWRAQRKPEAYLRSPAWAAELRALGRRVAELPGGPWLVFGVPSPIEGMFYARATYSAEPPTPDSLEQARSRGFRIAVYGDRSDPALREIRDERNLTFLARPAGGGATRRPRARGG